MSAEFPTQKVLELACAAQRVNKEYLKEAQNVFDSEGKFLFVKHTNKDLVRWALGTNRTNVAPEFAPQDIFIQDTDKVLAEEIKKYYRRFMFAAIKGDNEFQTEVNALLGSENMPSNKIGYVACLPSTYARDLAKTNIERKGKECDDAYLSGVGQWIIDQDCEILSCIRSKNFDAYNIDAIISNKLVSWMGNKAVTVGFAVVQKAKVKDHGHHWQTKKNQTRLHYVKVFQ